MGIEYANKNNLELLAMPIHPFSRVSDQKVSNNKKAIIYSLILFFMIFQLAKIHKGVKKVESKIINKDIPSTPT